MKTLAESTATSEDVQALKAPDRWQGGGWAAGQRLVHRLHGQLVQGGEGLGVRVVALGDEESILAAVGPVLQLLTNISMTGFHPGLVHHRLHAWLVHLASLERRVEPSNLLRPVEDRVRLAPRLLHAHVSVVRSVELAHPHVALLLPHLLQPHHLDRVESIHRVTLVHLRLLRRLLGDGAAVAVFL